MELEQPSKVWEDDCIMTRTTIKCPQQLDVRGVLEEFTSDVTDVAKVHDVSHLDSHGLVKTGTLVSPGMILIGKVGAKQAELDVRKMTGIEQLTTSPEEQRAYWQQLLYDGSVYAPSGCFGKVTSAYFEVDGKRLDFPDYETAFGVGVVEIECAQSP
jgi:DNA-directed RNA polymerase beta subunit